MAFAVHNANGAGTAETGMDTLTGLAAPSVWLREHGASSCFASPELLIDRKLVLAELAGRASSGNLRRSSLSTWRATAG